MEAAFLRPLVVEAIGTFALVFAGAGAIMVDAKTHALVSRRRRDQLRARDHGDDLRGSPCLRGPFQPGAVSFAFALVIIAVATDARAVGEAAALAIGATVGLDAMFE